MCFSSPPQAPLHPHIAATPSPGAPSLSPVHFPLLGPQCTYAHGECELRFVPPEVVAQLEAQQKLQESMQQRQGGPGISPGGGDQQRGGEEGNGHGPHGGGPGMSPGGGGGGGHQSFYKTRLCIKYMQTGYCHKGGSCTFAHGYEDLRQPGTPMSPGRMQQDHPMSPGRMGMGTHTGMPMMHTGMMGGMTMLPAGMTTAGRSMGMPPGGGGGMPMHMQSMQMAAMGMGPQGMVRYPSGGGGGGQQGMQRSPRAGGGHGGHGGRDDPASGARRRASTVCQMAGVGEAGGEEMRPAAVQAAMADVRSGAAFRESAYADSVTDYVRTNGGPGGPGAS